MDPSELCVSLETARKLKDAGFPQNTYFNWCEHSKEVHIWDCPHKDDPAAPTTNELLAALPQRIDHSDNPAGFDFELEKRGSEYAVAYGSQKGWLHKTIGTLPEALAQLWLKVKSKRNIRLS